MSLARIPPAVLLSTALSIDAAAQSQTPGPDAALDAIRASFIEVATWVIKAGELAPEDKLSFRPVESVRTLGQLLGHIADGNNYYCQKAAGKNPEWVETVALSGAGKAKLLEELRKSIADCTSAHSAANQARVNELVADLGHISLHYGNLVTYLRMLGITPPSS